MVSIEAIKAMGVEQADEAQDVDSMMQKLSEMSEALARLAEELLKIAKNVA